MKTIIVTDPCYILDDKTWDELGNKYGWDDEFVDKLGEKLREISGDDKAVVGTTGFGDWENEIAGHSFYADSGLVCVVKETEALKDYLKELLPLGGAARLEVPEDAFYELNFMNPHWTKVIIWEDGFKKKIAESLDEEELCD